jgi:hypothetical protein
MAGIEKDKIRETYNLPEDFEPVTGTALGYLGEPDRIPEPMRPMENAPRIRKPFSETVFAGEWERPADL